MNDFMKLSSFAHPLEEEAASPSADEFLALHTEFLAIRVIVSLLMKDVGDQQRDPKAWLEQANRRLDPNFLHASNSDL